MYTYKGVSRIGIAWFWCNMSCIVRYNLLVILRFTIIWGVGGLLLAVNLLWPGVLTVLEHQGSTYPRAPRHSTRKTCLHGLEEVEPQNTWATACNSWCILMRSSSTQVVWAPDQFRASGRSKLIFLVLHQTTHILEIFSSPTLGPALSSSCPEQDVHFTSWINNSQLWSIEWLKISWLSKSTQSLRSSPVFQGAIHNCTAPCTFHKHIQDIVEDSSATKEQRPRSEEKNCLSKKGASVCETLRDLRQLHLYLDVRSVIWDDVSMRLLRNVVRIKLKINLP